MRITLSSSALSSRLGTLAKVINSKNSLAILDCFLFEVANNQLTITASDSENVMRTTMPLETSDGEGKFAVNNHTILDAVKELPEVKKAIEEHERRLNAQEGEAEQPNESDKNNDSDNNIDNKAE
jgi:DNA polymerase-3 subunit beta